MIEDFSELKEDTHLPISKVKIISSKTNVKKSYKYRACLLNDDKGLNRTVVFTKSPSTFAEDRRQDKLASYLADEYGYTSQIANEIVVSPAIINLIASRDCTLGEFKEAKAQWFSNRG